MTNDWFSPGELATFRADLNRIRRSMRAADLLIDTILDAIEDRIEEQGLDAAEVREKVTEAFAPAFIKGEAAIDRKTKTFASKRTARRAARRAKQAGTSPPAKFYTPDED